MEGWRQPLPQAPRGSRVAMESRRRPGGGRPRRCPGHRSQAGPRSAARQLAALGSAFCVGALDWSFGTLVWEWGRQGEINRWGLEQASSGRVGVPAVPAAGLQPPAISKSGRGEEPRGPETEPHCSRSHAPCMRLLSAGEPGSPGRANSPAAAAQPERRGPASAGRVRAGRRADSGLSSQALGCARLPNLPRPGSLERGGAGRGAGPGGARGGADCSGSSVRPGLSSAEDDDEDLHGAPTLLRRLLSWAGVA